MLAFTPFTTEQRILLGFVCLMVLIGLPLIVFLSALLERRKVPSPQPLAAPELTTAVPGAMLMYDTGLRVALPEGTRPHPDLLTALDLGWTLVGHFHEESAGMRGGVETLVLSPEGCVLLAIRHGRTGRLQLNTRLQGGKWVVTTTSPSPNLWHLEDEALLVDAAFSDLLDYHMERLRLVRESAEPFSINSARQQMLQHRRDEIEWMVQAGLARYCNADRTLFVCTWRGAFKMASKLAVLPFTMVSSKRLREARAKAKKAK